MNTEPNPSLTPPPYSEVVPNNVLFGENHGGNGISTIIKCECMEVGEGLRPRADGGINRTAPSKDVRATRKIETRFFTLPTIGEADVSCQVNYLVGGRN